MAVNCRHMFGQIKPPQHRRNSRRFEPTPTVEPIQNFKKPKVTENKTHTELPSNTTQQSVCSRPGPAHLYNLRWWRSQLKTIASSGPRHLLWNTNQDLKDLVPDLVWTEFEVFFLFRHICLELELWLSVKCREMKLQTLITDRVCMFMKGACPNHLMIGSLIKTPVPSSSVWLTCCFAAASVTAVSLCCVWFLVFYFLFFVVFDVFCW